MSKYSDIEYSRKLPQRLPIFRHRNNGDSVATHKEDVSPEELERRVKAMYER